MKSWVDVFFMLLLTMGITVGIYFLPSEQSEISEERSSVAVEIEENQASPTEMLYGIPVSSYQITSGKVRWGESLAELLLPYGISMQKIHSISQLSDTLIDERKISSGNSFSIFSTNDTTPVYFIYEKDPLHYVLIHLSSDSIWAQNGQKAIENRLQIASGTIETSLWESMRNANANPMLAIELSEIFAWSIDFFGVLPGDQYKVIYQESFVDSESIGIHKILGAWIYHSETDFWGIPFEQNGVRSFFDDHGNSLRKAFLKAPLRYSRISSRFSNSRLHPILKIRRPHHGVDYVAPAGTPVLSVGDGVVTRKGYQSSGGGNYVTIKHNSMYSTTYMHLSRFGKGINQGVYVKQGDVIGYVGSTGLSTGPHLDFRFYQFGKAVNPLTVDAPPVEPIDEENRVPFGISRAITMQALKLL